MSIKRTIIVTVAIAASVAMVAPMFAGAVTVADLQAQINALLARLQTLQGGGQQVISGSGACAGISFNRNLMVGSTGSDVKCLQTILNSSASTKVASTGAGSPGYETSYFGGLTLAAVKVYQAQHGWTPANQVGPLTRGALNAYLATSGNPGNPPVIIPTGAGLSVMLASDNPASGIVVAGQGLASLAKFVFVNGDNAAVKVTTLTVSRIGISADADLANVYLMQGAIRLTDAAAVSSGSVNFNDPTGLFTVPAGSSVEITVASDICNTTNCTTIVGQSLGIQIASASNVASNASSIRGNFPVSGNLMTVSNATLGSVVFSATTTPSTATGVNPQNDYVVWQNGAVVGTRAVNMTRIAFREIGSINYSDLQNFRLYVDGVQVGSAVANLNANGYVTFDLTSAPKALQTGTRVIKLVADIVGGSTRTFNFSIRVAGDANFVDSQYGVNIAPTTATSSGAFTLADVTAGGASGSQTIATGTLTIAKTTDSASGNVVNNASNAVLAKYTLTAAGEPVKVTDLYVRAIFTNVATGSGNDCAGSSAVCTSASNFKLRNGALYANGVQIGSTTDLSPVAAGTHFSLGSSLIVNPNSPVTLEVRADVYDNTGTYNDVDATDTIAASIVSTSSNAQGMVSSSSITTPSATTNGNTLTVQTGALVLSKYTAYTAQAVVAPLTNYKLADFTLTANTTESINVSTIAATLNYVSSYTTNLYVKFGTNTTTVKPTVTATNTWSVNYLLAAGTTVDVSVYGDVSSSMSTGSGSNIGVAGLYVDGTTTSSSTSVCADTNSTCTVNSESALAGQNITFTSGTLTTATVTPPDNQIVSGGQSVVAGTFKLSSSYQNYTVSEMRFTVPSTSSYVASGAIVSATLKDGSTVVKDGVPWDNTNNYFNFTGLNISVPASTSKSLTLVWNLSIPSYTASTSDVDTKAALTYVKYSNPSGPDASSPDTNTRTANSTLVYRSVPTMATVALNGTSAVKLVNTTATDLYKFTVSAPTQGPVSIKQFKLAIAFSDGGGNDDQLALGTLKLLRNGSDITSSVTIQGNAALPALNAVSEGDTAIIVTWNGSTEDEVTAGGSVTYTLRGTPAGWNTTSTVSTATAPDSASIGFTADTAAQTAGLNFLNAGTSTTTVAKLWSSATSGSGSAEGANLIWSDESAVGHTAAVGASSTGDWSNSYLMPNTSTQSITD